MPRANIHRQIYFDTTIKLQPIKDCISGKNEEMVIGVLNSLGYKLNEDYKRQHPIGSKFVIDIAFINEQVALEVDGESHRQKKQIKQDKKRDRFLRENNWIPIRINDKDFFGYKALFYKYLIQNIVTERRQQFQNGKLYPIEIPDYNDND